MMNILITSAGQRVSLVRAFQKEVTKMNPESRVYTVDLNSILAPACHVSHGARDIKTVTDKDYIKQLLAICVEWDIKMIIPTIDKELLVLAKNKSLLLENGIVPIVCDLSFIEKCRDKRIINDFFKEHNIDVPLEVDKTRPSFPLFIKPYDGSLSKDIFLVQNESDFTDYHFTNPKMMFMEYINPEEYDEYTVDAYYNKNNELKCVVPRKRIFVRSGEINKGVTHKNVIIDYVKSRLSKIEGAIGCLTMQFFFNPITERIVGIEINPRFGGGYPLSYLAGANYPKWLLEEYLMGKQIPFFNDWENNLLMLRYDDEVLVRNYEG